MSEAKKNFTLTERFRNDLELLLRCVFFARREGKTLFEVSNGEIIKSSSWRERENFCDLNVFGISCFWWGSENCAEQS